MSMPPDATDATSTPSAQVPDDVMAGVRHFNARDFFEAHEAWEDHWGKGGPGERALTLGLIKAAVALHHLASGNHHGFVWQAEQALPHLQQHHALWPELRLGALAEALESLLAQHRFHGDKLDVQPDALPRIPPTDG